METEEWLVAEMCCLLFNRRLLMLKGLILLLLPVHFVFQFYFYWWNCFGRKLNSIHIDWTGDNIFGTSASDAAESLFGAFGPAIESGLPWAAVLGNHDQKSTMNRRELIDFISLLDYSVAQTNPPDLEDDIDGLGNYDLKVYGPPGSILANSSILNLFFLDSGDREIFQGVQTYGWIKESQLRWLRGVSQV